LVAVAGFEPTENDHFPGLQSSTWMTMMGANSPWLRMVDSLPSASGDIGKNADEKAEKNDTYISAKSTDNSLMTGNRGKSQSVFSGNKRGK
jgi:hypothetical protein